MWPRSMFNKGATWPMFSLGLSATWCGIGLKVIYVPHVAWFIFKFKPR
jgi:hypothetical protein